MSNEMRNNQSLQHRTKIRKKVKIRNRYYQAPELTQDTTCLIQVQRNIK